MKKNLVRNSCFLLLLINILSSCGRVSDNWEIEIKDCVSSSSPKAIDLNGDGVLDIIMGAGGDEWIESEKGIIAIDGYNGEIIWTAKSKNQIIGSAVFYDINKDDIPDVIIGGRTGELYALNGKNGIEIWNYNLAQGINLNIKNLVNFYNPQIILDQNNDSVKDIIICHGGDALMTKGVIRRKAGEVLMISGKNGKIISKAIIPDDYETYCSIVCLDCDKVNPSFIFSSGGEDKPGKMYLAKLSDLKKGDFSKSIILDTTISKGYEAPPILCDFNKDGIFDIIFTTVNGTTKVINGKTFMPIWSNDRDSAEVFSQVAVGNFLNNDNIPDVFVNYAIGEYPNYKYTEQRILDGATGQIKKTYKSPYFSYSSPLVADLDNDGIDEVLLSKIDDANKLEKTIPFYYIQVYNFKEDKLSILGDKKRGTCFASTPWIGDLDNDNKLDLIYSGSPSLISTFPGSTMLGRASKALFLHHFEFYNHKASNVKWGEYMGKETKSIYN